MRVNLSFPVSFDFSKLVIGVGLATYFVLATISLVTGSTVARLLSGFVGLAFVFLFVFSYRLKLTFPIFLIVSMLAGVVLSPLVNLGSSLFFVASVFSTVCISIYVRDYSLGHLAILIPFKIFSSFLLFLWLLKGYGPGQFNELFSGYSRNGVGAILLAFMVGHVWYCYEKDLKPSMFWIALAFVLMFPLYGRANIFFSGGVFLLALHLRFGAVGVLIFGLTALGITFLFSESLFLYFSTKTNFSSGFESARVKMLMDYVSSLNVKSLVFGIDLNSIESIREYGGNAHNAFLRAHAFFGVAILPGFMVLLVAIGVMIFNTHFVLLLLSLVFLGRAFLDIIFFGNIFDFMLWGPLLHYFRPELLRITL